MDATEDTALRRFIAGQRPANVAGRATAIAAVALAAALVTGSWLRLEVGRAPLGELVAVLALALLPAAAILFRRSWILAGFVGIDALLVAAGVAFDVPVTDARPRSDRDFFGPVADRFHQGFLDYYDTTLPFDRDEFGLMHGLVLLAIFGFVAVAAVLLAARLPVAACAVLLVAAGWPATLHSGGRPLLLGALGLAALLAILVLARDGRLATRRLVGAAAAATVLLAIAVGASTSEAVAKQGFVGWRAWDLYDAPLDPVGVRYVWSSHYQGISFPKKETEVLRVKVDGGKQRRLYWRATILDEYTGVGWREALNPEAPLPAREVDFTDDPLLPAEALDEGGWVKQEVVVGALSDNHLIASAQPVRVATGTSAPVRRAESGVVVLPKSLRIGQRYTAWSYVPDVKLADLVKTSGFYPAALNRYLELVPGVRLPPWSARGRDDRVDEIFAENSTNFLAISYEAVYRQARDVVGEAKSPYAAALALEAWFRSEGGFAYDEQPPRGTAAEPPLVAFVLRTRAGYCQHFAGAMAVMLRLLGVPARVAAGFTSGKFDQGKKEWVVTDHNAHTWVEVYFPGFGWLPFDPTPGRGQLGAAYSSGSSTFATGEGFTAPDVALLGRSAVLDAITAQALRLQRAGLEGTGAGASGGAGGVASGSGRLSILSLVLLVLAGAISALLGLKRARRELRFVTRDPRVLAGACRRDVAGFLADQGVSLPWSTTLAELGRVVEREFVVDAAPFVRSASLARFGRPADAEEAARRARRELRVLRKQMRRELPAAARVRGAFSLRSLVV